jgi:hypothetical protein
MAKKIITTIAILMLFYFLFSNIAEAQVQAVTQYKLLEGLPVQGLEQGQSATFNSYANGAIRLGIIIAALLAVVMLVIAGIMYMSAGGSTGRVEKAKDLIWNAIIGLIIAVSYYLILYAINPEMLKLDAAIKQLDVRQPSTAASETKAMTLDNAVTASDYRDVLNQGAGP